MRAVATAALTALLAIALTQPTALAEPQRAPLLAVDPLPELAELECRTEALPRWLSRGITGATLLLVDASAGVLPPNDARAAQLAGIRRSAADGAADLAGLEAAGKTCALEAQFVRAAFVLGIVREVFWIVPYDSFRGPDPAGHLRGDLLGAGVSEEEFGTFALRDGCLRGTAGGMPLSVCGLEGLPPLDGPVLLSAHVEFILAAVAAARTNPVAEIRRLLAALAARRYPLVDAAISTGVADGRLPPESRWVGETLAHALHDPALLANDKEKRRWDRLQSLTMLLGARRFTDLFHEVWPLLQIHGEDPALHLLAAEALLGLGKKDEALERAEEACRLLPAYCYGLPAIGLRLLGAVDLDGAERFFDSGQRLRPGMGYGQFDRGLALLWAGRQEQALAAFLTLSDAGLAFPAGFLAGEIYLQRGDRQAALRQFDRAFETLRLEPGAEADHPETLRAVQAAIRLYREEGFGAKADLLKENPRLTPPEAMPPDAP